MTVQRCFLFAYSCLLRLYPATFRRRFGSEMLQLAEEAERNEWALIFSDTSVGILRNWLQPAKDRAMVAEADADLVGYHALAEYPLPVLRLVQGFVLSTTILLGAYYVSSVPSLWRFPDYPDCKASQHGEHRLGDAVARDYGIAKLPTRSQSLAPNPSIAAVRSRATSRAASLPQEVFPQTRRLQ